MRRKLTRITVFSRPQCYCTSDIGSLGSGGHVLGYGGEATSSATSSTAATARGQPLHHHDVTTKEEEEEENELMEIGESGQNKEQSNSHSDDSDSGSDDDDENAPDNQNHQMFPPPLRNVGLPPGFGQRGARLPWGRGPRQFQGLGGGGDDDDDDDMFEGQGHRLGGKEDPPRVGDLQLGEIKMHDAGMCMWSLSLPLCLSPSLCLSR